ncbi:MAG: diaminopimelate epimerase [Candidatus Omnitrophica bacterium]|nr:diaminopimelate epimerase [Candidatus Omnitrophota bacterium]
MLEAQINTESIKVRMTEPKDLRLNVGVELDGRIFQVDFINTGVPHAVHFVPEIDSVNVRQLGRVIRYHREFAPQGTNVDFVKIIEPELVAIRTYERGVENETLACGTGAVAAALLSHHKFGGRLGKFCMQVQTRGGEVLKVYFDYRGFGFKDVWLEGKARIVYQGECYV